MIIYFNNNDDYLNATNSSNTSMFESESDCRVYFVQYNTSTMSSVVNYATNTQSKVAKGGYTQKYTRWCGWGFVAVR